MKKEPPRFGAHMSAAGGLENAFQAGAAAGCDSLQVFVKNQRQWNAKPLTPEQIEAYRVARSGTGLTPVIAHASYLLNLASPDASNRAKSIAALDDELSRCDRLGVDFLVFHPGATMGSPESAALGRVSSGLNRIFRKRRSGSCVVLIENTAGQGSAVGHRFEQIGEILSGVRDESRVGVCIDTCHAFAAGYDFRSEGGYRSMMATLDSAIGVARVMCIHTNDSKKPAGSRVDRHEHIGKGKIGKAGFTHFVNDRKWSGVPFILETPKGKDGRGSDLDKVNLKRLRGMFRG